MMNDDTIQRIETLLAHHERQIQDLNDVITRQGKEIDTLKLRLDKTQKKLIEIEASPSGPDREGLSVSEQAAMDKPPHY